MYICNANHITTMLLSSNYLVNKTWRGCISRGNPVCWSILRYRCGSHSSPFFFSLLNPFIMRTTADNTTDPKIIYDQLLGILTDLKVLTFAWHHQYEMPEDERGEMPTTATRILERLETVVGETSNIAALSYDRG